MEVSRLRPYSYAEAEMSRRRAIPVSPGAAMINNLGSILSIE
jgi:hypothetical protein